MTPARPHAALRPFLPSDAPMLAMIYRASIEELTGEDYSERQREAWMSAADDEEAFGRRLAGQLTLVATIDGAPVGFASLKGADRIDLLYVHPGVAGQGVASLLCDAIEKLAAARGTRRLGVEASDTALPFFQKRGYAADTRNTVAIEGEWLGNTSMHKILPPPAAKATMQ